VAAARFEDARLLAAQGRAEDALSALEALLIGEPDHVPALLLRGQLLVERREGESAQQLYERATRLAPESSEAWNGLARCLHALGRDEEALRAAERARELLPRGENFRHASPVYLTLVWCLREMRRYREALAVADEGLERCPDAILAQWAGTVEEELAEAEKEEC
jgi:tetratricopeptide (TPR) repeat protein